MRAVYQDLRFAVRMLGRNPGYAITAIACLGLGIGACTAILSVVNAVLLRPLPFTDSERLMAISEYDLEEGHDMGVSPRLLFDLKEQTQSFEGIAFFDSTRMHVAGGEFPEAVHASLASINLFSVLRARPLLGRTFLPGEDQPGRDNVAVISYGLWKRKLGGDPNLVGKTISCLDLYANPAGERDCTVIGVMPSWFQTPSFYRHDIWMPNRLEQAELDDRTHRSLNVVARLKADATPRRARAEVLLLSQRLAEQYPQAYKGHAVRIQPLRTTFIGQDVQQSLLILAGAVAFVLLIACANVAGMLLARATARQKEVAIRATLGAGRRRLIMQLLTESILLALLGAALGLLFAHWGIGLLKPLIPVALVPLSEDVGVDLWTLACTLAISVVTGVAFGLAPALQLSKPNLTEALKEGGGGGSTGAGNRKPLQSLLVVSQVALTLVLLIGAGLLTQTLIRLLHVDPGFEPRNLMEFEIMLPRLRYKESSQKVVFYEGLFERLRSLPGVRSVAAVTRGWGFQSTVEGQASPIFMMENPCSAGTYDYLRTVGIPLLQGRYFTRADIAGPDNSIIINETAARQLWPGENPIGKRLPVASSYTVIGVVAAPRLWARAYEEPPGYYIPYGTYRNPHHLRGQPYFADFVVRSDSDPLDLVKAIRRELAALDSRLPVGDFIKVEDRLRESTAPQRLYMQLLTIFAAIGLILAAAGIYGLISYSVTRRTHEIGVRMALGAKRSDVLKLVLKRGLTMIIVGLFIGITGALALTQVLANLLFGVTATDPMTFVAVSLLLTTVGLLACYIPARRATRIDPMSALRYE